MAGLLILNDWYQAVKYIQISTERFEGKVISPTGEQQDDLPGSGFVCDRPSCALRLVQAVVRSGLVRRGYSWLFAFIPPVVWGGRSIVVKTDVGGMCLPTGDRSSSSLLCLGHLDHERRETALVSLLAKSCDVMFDLGAHHGWYSRVMGLANRGARVFAFEPDPITFSYLSRNVVDFPNVLCFSKGVGEKNSDATLWRARTSNLNSTVRRVGTPVPITLWSLDSLCQKQGIDQIDFIKCDVEGGEVTVLHGARELLRSVKPPIWMLEVSEQFLAEADYDPEDLLKAGGSDGKLFTQDAQGNTVEIQELSQRMFGNNVFFVPEVRLGQFYSAAEALNT